MAYSKKLMDLLTYYGSFFSGREFMISRDNKTIVNFCKKLEQDGFNFNGRPFLVSDYYLQVPVYNSNHESSGVYEDWIHPLAPFTILNDNYISPYTEIKLPKRNRSSSETKRFLSKIAKFKVGDSVIVSDKKLVEKNYNLDTIIMDYAKKICQPNILSMILLQDSIHVMYSSSIDITRGQSFDISNFNFGNEQILSEDDIVKYNVLGFLAANERGASVFQQVLKPEDKDPFSLN